MRFAVAARRPAATHEAGHPSFTLYRTFAERNDYDWESYPFLCECPEERCTQGILVSLPEYADVRSHLGRFVVAVGHGDRSDDPHVIEAGGGYEIFEKIGWSEAPLVRRCSGA